MIYVLKSSGYDENENLVNLIKIGYTDNWDKRLTQYKIHNPTIKTLYLYDDGNEDDEKFLHSYFSEYKLSDYGREWFYYNNKIVDFFKPFKTIEEIRNLEEYCIEATMNDTIRELSKTKLEIITYINRISSVISNDVNKRLEFIDRYSSYRFLVKNKIGNVNKLFEFVNVEYGLNLVKKDFDFEKTEEIENFMLTYESLPKLYDKLKYLCEYKPTTNEFAGEILEHITEKHFKDYITVLGPERCRSLSYNVGKLNKELGILTFDQDILNFEIFKNFNVGDKLEKSRIKLNLGNIYSSLGYKKTPKANDLEEWFEIKDVLINVGNKRVAGFEIIKKKG